MGVRIIAPARIRRRSVRVQANVRQLVEERVQRACELEARELLPQAVVDAEREAEVSVLVAEDVEAFWLFEDRGIVVGRAVQQVEERTLRYRHSREDDVLRRLPRAREDGAVPPERFLDRGAHERPIVADGIELVGIREERGEEHGGGAEGRVTTRVDELAQERDRDVLGERLVVDLGRRDHAHHVLTGVGAPLREHGLEVAAELRGCVERVVHRRVRDDLRNRELVEGRDVVLGKTEHPVDHVEGVRTGELLDELGATCLPKDRDELVDHRSDDVVTPRLHDVRPEPLLQDPAIRGVLGRIHDADGVTERGTERRLERMVREDLRVVEHLVDRVVREHHVVGSVGIRRRRREVHQRAVVALDDGRLRAQLGDARIWIVQVPEDRFVGEVRIERRVGEVLDPLDRCHVIHRTTDGSSTHSYGRSAWRARWSR